MQPCSLLHDSFVLKKKKEETEVYIVRGLHKPSPCYHRKNGYESMFGICSLCGKTCVPVASKEGAVLSMLARARLPFCCPFPTLVPDKWVEVSKKVTMSDSA